MAAPTNTYNSTLELFLAQVPEGIDDPEVYSALLDIHNALEAILTRVDEGGGSFTPTTFAGAGTTGYVPDPLVEQGYILSDDGTWIFVGSPADRDQNIDGGRADSIYTSLQLIDGGVAASIFDPALSIDGGRAASIYTAPQLINGGSASG